jgi:sarcosine oxidase, subunit beta
MTQTSETADAVIIGAGVIGAAVAFELCKRGLRTVNVDKFPAAGYGSTSSSSACVRAHYSSRPGVAMAHAGFSYWKDWGNYLGVEDERGIARYVNCGTVLLKSDEGQYLKATELYDELGVAYEDWDTDTLLQRVPYYDPHRFWPPSRPSDDSFWEPSTTVLDGAIYTPDSGYMSDPALATHNLQRAAEAAGGRFVFRREVREIRSDSRVRGVTLDNGDRIEAPIIVNVAGPYSGVVNRMAGVEQAMKIRTRPMRHEVHVVPGPPGVDLDVEGFHTADGDQGIYFRPESGGTLLVGSEDPECDDRDWVDDPDSFNRTMTRSHWEAQVYRLARRIPGLEVPPRMAGVVDLYDVSDDWIPVYDASDLPGYYMAVGSSGNQFKNAPVAGHAMAELITACEAGRDHDANPVQVTLPHTGDSLDLGFFSRNRAVVTSSSFGVNG